MARGIMLLGLNGCGKTTVGRMLADQLHFFRMDAEDYYFPIPGDYSHSRTEEEVHRMMEADIKAHEGFVLSCVRCNVSDGLLQHVQLAVVLHAPADVRAQRIVEREKERFGHRVLRDGDLYESQQAFRAFAAARSEDMVTQSLKRLSCPVLAIDAMLPLENIAEQISCAFSSRWFSESKELLAQASALR